MNLFRERPAADNIQLYLARAGLPPMPHAASAPPMPPSGHKAHRNKLTIRPQEYRSRFAKIVTTKSLDAFDKLVLEFTSTLPCTSLPEPNTDDATGIAFTIPAEDFNVVRPALRHPASLDDTVTWITALPLQTMTRALHVALPETRAWDVVSADGENFDGGLWRTLVWRQPPPPTDPDQPWLHDVDAIGECSLVFVLQPPWIMTPADFKSFMRCRSMPPFNKRAPRKNRPYTGAERVWAKLWDTCVRKDCHYWVVASYDTWVFGTFSRGFTAGQILGLKSYDASRPTIVECLAYHVASAMGIVKTTMLAQYLESTIDLEWDRDIPPPVRVRDMKFEDSSSEWDGMDDEPGISAGVSSYRVAVVSGGVTGSEFSCPPSGAPPSPFHDSRNVQMGPVAKVQAWGQEVRPDPPEFVRDSSPAPSESGFSANSIFQSALHGNGSGLPRVRVLHRGERTQVGAFLATVIEQGPLGGENEP